MRFFLFRPNLDLLVALDVISPILLEMILEMMGSLEVEVLHTVAMVRAQ